MVIPSLAGRDCCFPSYRLWIEGQKRNQGESNVADVIVAIGQLFLAARREGNVCSLQRDDDH